MPQTSELGVASGGETTTISTDLTDLNGDARQGLVFFNAGTAPELFFNRGFACFGIARTLSFAESKLPAAIALGSGQQAGLVTDISGDAVPDLVAVDRTGKLWAMLGEAKEPRQFHVTVSLANPAQGPLTVIAAFGGRTLGIWVVRPGEPTLIELAEAGQLTLSWKNPDGTANRKDVPVLDAVGLKL